MATELKPAESAVARVVTRGARLGLREAVWQLEQAGLSALGAGESGPGYRIEPAAEWTFPAAEIRRCRRVGDRRVVIEANVLALLGAEAPLPGYWLELAAREDPVGERIRSLLRTLNASVYAGLLAGWRALDGPASSAPWAQSLAALGTVPERGLGGLDLHLARRPSRAGLRCLLQRVIGEQRVAVADRQPVAQRLDERPLGGGQAPRLGDGWGLGGVAMVAGGLVGVRVGPVPPATASARVEQARARHLGAWLRRYLGPVAQVRARIIAAPGRLPAWYLGASAPLGAATWVGEWAARETSLPFPVSVSAAPEASARGERR
ncbi:type VI secretion system baseplate subunit TssG [Halorhodospira halophila]|uniref:type VI secretion system baseplate subunit TssG n=1 Tax=Halorhodospira halophila TaxID=1053 RepID=UPI001912DB65|nr:hypothetical protein [Halorhodospira halophila]